MVDLHGKVALVTGASRGIGRSVAAALAEAGADVAINYHVNEKEARKTLDLVRKTEQRGLLVKADVSRSSETAEMVDTITRELGPIQVLVNNAGISLRKDLSKVTEQDWDRVLAVNLKSAFLLTQSVFQGMRELRWGRIVNISSVAAQTGGITAPPYVASKAGMWGLTHSYAAILIKDGITVNTVAPALIETDMIRGLEAKPDRIPVGRFGYVEEVAEAVLMLVRNGYMTGQTISVNGGMYFT
jgi:3-oxoacyl-[acyl-carrier protein] reductase